LIPDNQKTIESMYTKETLVSVY